MEILKSRPQYGHIVVRVLPLFITGTSSLRPHKGQRTEVLMLSEPHTIEGPHSIITVTTATIISEAYSPANGKGLRRSQG